MKVPIEAYILLSALLFAIGMYGAIARRNVLIVLLSIEIMLNAGNLALVTFSRMHGNMDGQVMAVLVMAIAASEIVVGLGIVVALSHLRHEPDTDELVELRG